MFEQKTKNIPVSLCVVFSVIENKLMDFDSTINIVY